MVHRTARRPLFRRSIAAVAVASGIAAAVPAGAEAVSATGYRVSGPLTIWTEVKPPAGESWLGCVASRPKITFTASRVGDRGYNYTALALAPTKQLLPAPLSGLQQPFTTFGPWGAGPIELDLAEVVGLAGRFTPIFRPGQFPARGRFSLAAWLNEYVSVNRGLSVISTKFLPTKAVPYEIVANKPAGTCVAGLETGAALLALR